MNNFDFIENSLSENSGKIILTERTPEISAGFRGRLFTAGSIIINGAFQKISALASYVFGTNSSQNQENTTHSLTVDYHQNLNLKLKNIQQKIDEDLDDDLMILMKKYEL